MLKDGRNGWCENPYLAPIGSGILFRVTPATTDGILSVRRKGFLFDIGARNDSRTST